MPEKLIQPVPLHRPIAQMQWMRTSREQHGLQDLKNNEFILTLSFVTHWFEIFF